MQFEHTCLQPLLLAQDTSPSQQRALVGQRDRIASPVCLCGGMLVRHCEGRSSCPPCRLGWPAYVLARREDLSTSELGLGGVAPALPSAAAFARRHLPRLTVLLRPHFTLPGFLGLWTSFLQPKVQCPSTVGMACRVDRLVRRRACCAGRARMPSAGMRSRVARVSTAGARALGAGACFWLARACIAVEEDADWSRRPSA